jgi:hypothetical protein
MDCKKVRSLYTLFKDGDLDEHTKDEISRHIRECRGCERVFASLERITGTARTCKALRPKPEVIEDVIRQFDEVPVGRWFLAPRWVIGYAVVILFIAGFSIGLIRRVNINKQMIVQQREEQEVKREGRYIMDYGQFEKGQVIYAVPGSGNTVQVVETSY